MQIRTEFEGDRIYAWIKGIRGSVDLSGTGETLFLSMSLEEADKVAFHISSALQDKERSKEVMV